MSNGTVVMNAHGSHAKPPLHVQLEETIEDLRKTASNWRAEANTYQGTTRGECANSYALALEMTIITLRKLSAK